MGAGGRRSRRLCEVVEVEPLDGFLVLKSMGDYDNVVVFNGILFRGRAGGGWFGEQLGLGNFFRYLVSVVFLSGLELFGGI